MAYFRMSRNFTVSGLGHSIGFVSGKKTWVPPALHQEAMKFGAVPEDKTEDLGMPKQHEKPVIPVDGDRMESIIKACDYLQTKNSTDDFGANALPKLSAIKDIVDFDLSAKERDEAWVTMKQTKIAADNPTNANE